AALASEDEWRALAQHSFVSTYGTAATAWEVRVSRSSKGSTRVATAIDGELLQVLRDIPGIVSIQPYLMAAFNARRAHLRGPAWFVLQEPGRLTLSRLDSAGWQAIRCRQAHGDWRPARPRGGRGRGRRLRPRAGLVGGGASRSSGPLPHHRRHAFFPRRPAGAVLRHGAALMRALELDYLRSPGHLRRPRHILAAVALVFALDAGWQHYSLKENIALRTERLAQTGAAPLERQPARLASPEEYVFARDTIGRLATPWDRLFQALEAAQTEQIAL